MTTQGQTMRYPLQKFKEFIFNGFDFAVPETAVNIINYLSGEIGASVTLQSPVFQKKEHNEGANMFSQSGANRNRNRKKGNKYMENNNEDWETLRSFQSTKIEQHSGISGEIDNLRSNLNKLTDKTFQDIRVKIIETMDTISSSPDFNEENAHSVSTFIYDISSSNKFFSKIYADLYAELVTKYGFLRALFDAKLSSFSTQFETIQYTSPDTDYDRFCENNKVNECRRSQSLFLVNLALNGFIRKLSVARILRQLLETVMNTVNRSEKKNEIDELTENVAILFNKTIIEGAEDDSDYEEDELEISGNTIVETITLLAKSKVKDYKSLTNKAVFKYMDLVEM
jgi:hypothetical protein